MLRKSFLAAVVGLLLVPAFAQAQFNKGDWELTLSGSGSANKGTTAGDFSGNVGLGYFATKEIEIGVRQSATWSDVSGDKSRWGGSTRLALDYHFDFDKFQPFVGVNGGYAYPADSLGSWEVAPEAGLKYFVNATTFLYGLVEYQIHTRDTDASQFVYSLGIGFKF